MKYRERETMPIFIEFQNNTVLRNLYERSSCPKLRYTVKWSIRNVRPCLSLLSFKIILYNEICMKVAVVRNYGTVRYGTRLHCSGCKKYGTKEKNTTTTIIRNIESSSSSYCWCCLGKKKNSLMFKSLVSSISLANDHTTLKAPLLVRSAKLSNVGSG